VVSWIGKNRRWLNGYAKKPKPEKKEKPEEDAVVFMPVKCPNCDAKGKGKIITYGNTPPIRYHKCKSCGRKFKSIEKE